MPILQNRHITSRIILLNLSKSFIVLVKPTTSPPTTTNTSEATTTAPATEAVGSAEALEAQVEGARELLVRLYPDSEAEDLPVPDLTNPDPLIAMRELLLFELAALEAGSISDYADILSQQRTQANDSYRRTLNTFENGGYRFRLLGEYEIIDVVSVELADIVALAGDQIVADAPNGAAYVRYTTSSGPYNIVNRDEEVVRAEDGWAPRTLSAILSPTSSGWKYYWAEMP